MILVSGFNVYPSEIEEVIAKHPKVLEVALCNWCSDEKSGEVPKLFCCEKRSKLNYRRSLNFAKEKLNRL